MIPINYFNTIDNAVKKLKAVRESSNLVLIVHPNRIKEYDESLRYWNRIGNNPCKVFIYRIWLFFDWLFRDCLNLPFFKKPFAKIKLDYLGNPGKPKKLNRRERIMAADDIKKIWNDNK